MKKLLLSSLLLGAILYTSNLFSQNELLEKRTQSAKHYELENGSFVAEVSGGSIHYKDNEGKWQDINSEITPSNNPQYNYENSTNNLRSYYSNSGVLINVAAGNIKIGVNPSLVLINSSNEEEMIEAQSHSIGIVSGSTIVYKNAFLSGDIEYIVENDKVKNNLILNNIPLQVVNKNGFLGFSENIVLPKGWYITHKGNKINNSEIINGQLVINDKDNNAAIIIPSPEVFDANINSEDGLNQNNSAYKVIKNSKGYQIITMVPLSWLKNSARVYPVKIDPTVTLPGTLGGWQNSAPAFVDNNGFVFTGTLTAQDYRGWVQFDISSIPSGNGISLVETELEMNGTGNAAFSEIININDVTGTKGIYGAVDTSAYTDFGNGLYTSFTALATGAYGYYDLGTSAITNLAADLPSGTFQYATEIVAPTTWKRFQANNCNLRVTYAPCTSSTSGTLDSTICNGDSVIFNGVTYNGINNSGVDTIASYTGCDSIVTITITELLPITGTLDSAICEGASFIFNGTTYNASNNTGVETLTAASGCDSLVTVTVSALIDTSTTTNNNTISSNATTGASYEWIDCGSGNAIVPAETNQNFTANANGDYAVIVTIGSCSDTSACVNIATVGLNENSLNSNILLYPNPSNDNVNINFGQALNNGSVVISDITGKEVYGITDLNKQVLNLDIKHFSRGVYFVKVLNNNEQKVIKLIKQ
ncbi:MAG: T9SS type A sorting domain-containing protein [Vicingaceae bacterium]|nr:T9SS type A sorting domain-containing protein [Vicingaceae bacterium]